MVRPDVCLVAVVLVEAFTDTIGLQALGLGAQVMDALDFLSCLKSFGSNRYASSVRCTAAGMC
jgi:hypothetical protein